MPTEPFMMHFGDIEGRDIPHIVIEVNQTCNISCTACYKSKSSYSKPLDVVRSEIDFALARRRLQLLTLAGGEASIHPDLPEIIRHAVGKGVVVQLLSNGLALDDARLARFAEAGLTKIYLHVDGEQRRHDLGPRATEEDRVRLRNQLAARIRKHGMHCGLSFTLYQDRLHELVAAITAAIRNPDVRTLFFTGYTDFAKVASELGIPGASAPAAASATLRSQVVRNEDVERLLREHFGMEPFAYLPSSHDDRARRWIRFCSFVIQGPNGEATALHTNARFGRLARIGTFLDRHLRGRYTVENTPSAAACVGLVLAYAALSLDRRALPFLARLLRPGRTIRSLGIVSQQGPNVGADGQLEYCKGCPDATVRDGQLVPVCMADFLRPLQTEKSLQLCG